MLAKRDAMLIDMNGDNLIHIDWFFYIPVGVKFLVFPTSAAEKGGNISGRSFKGKFHFICYAVLFWAAAMCFYSQRANQKIFKNMSFNFITTN